LAARGNFCSLDSQGNITDRRAGRIATEVNAALCADLRAIALPGVQVFVEPVKEHRFVLVLRGHGLRDELSETDPQRLGVPPLPVQPLAPQAQATADLVNQFVAHAREILRPHHPANGVLLRGFAKRPRIPTLQELYGIKPACIAVYPMYKGLATLAGMEIVPVVSKHGDPHGGSTIEEEFLTLAQVWDKYTFFFLHVKGTDSAGEDGNFDRKVAIIEEVDRHLPILLNLNPDVVMITGDHSTPALLRSHSWHPVPFLLYSRAGYARSNGQVTFGETACSRGVLGTFPGSHALRLALATALRLTKYGA